MSSTTRGPRTTFSAQVLILLAAYLFGGGGGDDAVPLTEHVRKVIEDDTRREVANGYALEIENALIAVGDGNIQVRLQILAAMHQVPRDGRALREELRRAMEQSMVAQGRIVDLRFQLKETMTREEWGKLFERLREER